MSAHALYIYIYIIFFFFALEGRKLQLLMKLLLQEVYSFLGESTIKCLFWWVFLYKKFIKNSGENLKFLGVPVVCKFPVVSSKEDMYNRLYT